jgi:hypothetical protein
MRATAAEERARKQQELVLKQSRAAERREVHLAHVKECAAKGADWDRGRDRDRDTACSEEVAAAAGRQAAADQRRRTMESLRREQLRSSTAAWSSRVETARELRQRVASDSRVRLNEAVRRAALRREQLLEDVVRKSRQHTAAVGTIKGRLHAVRRLQRWARAAFAASPSASAATAAARVRWSRFGITGVDAAWFSVDHGGSAALVRRLQAATQPLRTSQVRRAAALLEREVLQHAVPSGARDGAAFETLVGVLQRRDVIASTQTFTQSVVSFCDDVRPLLTHAASASVGGRAGVALDVEVEVSQHGCDDAEHPLCPSSKLRPAVARSARTLLAAALIALCPNEVLGEDAEAQASLVALARDAVAKQAAAVSCLRCATARTCVDISALMSFNLAYCAYLDGFMIWKLGDGSRLAQQIAPSFRASVLALRRYNDALASVDASSELASGLLQLRDGTAQHLHHMRAQVTSFIGAKRAAAWERDFVDDVDAEVRAAAVQQQVAADAAASASATDTASVSSASASLPSSPGSDAAPAPAAASSTSSNPPSAHSSPKMKFIRGVLSNEAFAHELMLDPEFRLPGPAMDAELVVGEPATRPLERTASLSPGRRGGSSGSGGNSFCAPLASSSSARCSPAYWRAAASADVHAAVLQGLTDISEGLRSLVPHRTDLHRRICANIDTELLGAMMKSGALDNASWLALVHFIAEQILQLEAPVRHSGEIRGYR